MFARSPFVLLTLMHSSVCQAAEPVFIAWAFPVPIGKLVLAMHALGRFSGVAEAKRSMAAMHTFATMLVGATIKYSIAIMASCTFLMHLRG